MKEIVFVEINRSFMAAVKEAKRLGYNVTLLTHIKRVNPNHYNDLDLGVFNTIVEVDTQEVDEMYQVITPDNTAGILACYDDHVFSAAQLAEKLSLPHPNLRGLAKVRCKDAVRVHLKKHGFIQPEFCVIEEKNGVPKIPYIISLCD